MTKSILALLTLFAALTSAAAQRGSDTKSADLSEANVAKIKVGMNLEAVEAIIGAPGKLQNVSLRGKSQQSFYVWQNDRAALFVILEDGRVTDKNRIDVATAILRERPAAAELTIGKYEGLKLGISYAEAVRLIGSEGAEQPSLATPTSKSYTWTSSDLSTLSATFTRGRLTLKSQSGLGPWPEYDGTDRLTMARFDAVAMGAGLATVEATIGRRGRLGSSNQDATMIIETYEWKDPDGASITIVFSSRRVTSKSRSRVRPPVQIDEAAGIGNLTLANFVKLKPGMTRAEVNAILGNPGVSVDFSESGKTTFESVEWSSPSGRISAEFRDGKLSNANRSGLK